MLSNSNIEHLLIFQNQIFLNDESFIDLSPCLDPKEKHRKQSLASWFSTLKLQLFLNAKTFSTKLQI